jgi:hypothetical protein
MIRFVLSLFLIQYSVNCFSISNFNFNKGLHKFGLWGSGIGKYDSKVGHKSSGSIMLSTDFGENITAYRNFTGLKSGNYRISYYIKSDGVQKHTYNGLWNFYDSGFGSKDVFRKKTGVFGWTKIEYIIKVKKEIKFWIRLKTAGKVWFDDFKITKVNLKPSTYKSTLSSLKGHDFKPKNKHTYRGKSRKTLTSDAKAIEVGKYLNFFPSSFHVKKLSGYTRLLLNLYNPTKNNYDFYFVIQDKNSSNYWSQLNFKTTLAPGNNSLNLNMNRSLGERGSVRFDRKIDLENIKKMFLVVDPDKTGIPTDKEFKVSKLIVDTLKVPSKPRKVYAFDFSSQKVETIPGFTKVTSQDIFSEKKGFGFVDPTFYRVYDSKYASSINRSYINVLKSDFDVNLPNGEYELELNISGLGYWDVPFWKKRKVILNNKVIHTSTRSTASDYLFDYFQFENVEPSPGDSLYDLYLSNIFKPIRTRVWVNNKKLNFKFEGDATGININSLIIWPTKISSLANIYLKEINDLKRKENNIISRELKNKTVVNNKKFSVTLLDPTLELDYSNKTKSNITKLSFSGLSNETSFKIIQLKNNSDVTRVSLSLEAKNINDAITFQPIKYQYSALDMNHETYRLLAKIVSPVSNLIELEPNEVRYILVKVDFNKVSSKSLKSKIILTFNEHKTKIDIDIHKVNYELPSVKIAVGFLGLETIGPLYFKNNRLSQFKQNLRLKALDLLSKNGFTSFSGLPKVKFSRSNEKINIEDSYLRSILSKAKNLKMGRNLFTYSGEFPVKLLENLKSKFDYLQVNEYFAKLNKEFSQQIVYTFSDEAGGYSNRLLEDTNKAKLLNKKIPNLKLGGFSGMHKNSKQLNDYFDYGFYSSINLKDISSIKMKGHSWGTYNGSYLPMNDPQFAFGIGLYYMEKAGLSHYLDWHLNATHNYPYFELDGRETDSVMFYPRSNGDLYTSLKFEHAVLGLNTYRKLKLLDRLSFKMKPKVLKKYKDLKLSLKKQLNVLDFKSFYHRNRININKLNYELIKIFKML